MSSSGWNLTGDALAETLFSGVAVGCKYALVALGFVIVFKATKVLNFAQASFVLVGGFLCWQMAVTWELNFYVALLAAMVGGAVLGMVVEQLLMRRLLGEPPFALIMLTVGVLYVLDNVTTAIWGPEDRGLQDPWGSRTVDLGAVNLAVADLWTIGVTSAALLAFYLFFGHSSLGLAMRATADDQEAALAVGIDARTVHRVSWAVAGALGALAGIMLASGAGSVGPGLGLIALVAFPAMILGGLESPLGAVVGGLVIGMAQQLTALLQPEFAPWLGSGFERVAPYAIMVAILLVRPYGLFGEREVRRI
ncbi:branched-chain amino acid ABC transporter permease [Nocardioides jensenii]|uniref:branched-chain amino acid ABC transporter permease n=1 Tax=Nocardioides jensenii TaxID=1843 RepID=UPI000834E99E|nr:branched-chain amino acid ABC transporter permease [Nocardioides jensenii]